MFAISDTPDSKEEAGVAINGFELHATENTDVLTPKKYRVHVTVSPKKKEEEEEEEEPRKRARAEVTLSTKVRGSPTHLPTLPHVLVDRKYALEELADFLILNFTNRLSDSHKDHTTVYIPGGSRIGKTRIAFELCHIDLALVQQRPLFLGLSPPEQALLSRAIERKAHHLLLEFNGRDAHERHFDGSQDPSARLGVRLAARYHFRTDFQYLLTVCRGEFRHLRANAVLKQIISSFVNDLPTKEDVVLIVIHFDDFNLYVDSKRISSGLTYQAAVADFKDMVDEVGTFMREGLRDSPLHGRFVLLPVLAGASAADVYDLPTPYNRMMVRLRPLGSADNKSEEYGMIMADNKHAQEPLWPVIRKQAHFRIALADCGGIPGYIDYLLGPHPRIDTTWGSSLYCHYTFASPDDEDRDRVLSVELESFGGAEAARVLIELALTRTVVRRNFSLPWITIDKVEAIGGLFLSPVSPEREEFYVELPFITLKVLNTLLPEPLFPKKELLRFPTLSQPWRRQDFELLHLHYLQVRTGSLMHLRQKRARTLYVQQLIGGKPDLAAMEEAVEKAIMRGFPLGDVVNARGLPEMLGKLVLLRSLQVHREKEKFLPLETSVATLTHEVLCEDGKSYPFEEGNAFLCAPNNTLVDGRVAFATVSSRPLMVFWRHDIVRSDEETKEGKMSVEDIRTWYHQAWKALGNFAQHYELCLFFASNRPSPRSGEEETALRELFAECPNLLLVTREDFGNWLSPTLAHRGLMALDSPLE